MLFITYKVSYKSYQKEHDTASLLQVQIYRHLYRNPSNENISKTAIVCTNQHIQFAVEIGFSILRNAPFHQTGDIGLTKTYMFNKSLLCIKRKWRWGMYQSKTYNRTHIPQRIPVTAVLLCKQFGPWAQPDWMLHIY